MKCPNEACNYFKWADELGAASPGGGGGGFGSPASKRRITGYGAGAGGQACVLHACVLLGCRAGMPGSSCVCLLATTASVVLSCAMHPWCAMLAVPVPVTVLSTWALLSH